MLDAVDMAIGAAWGDLPLPVLQVRLPAPTDTCCVLVLPPCAMHPHASLIRSHSHSSSWIMWWKVAQCSIGFCMAACKFHHASLPRASMTAMHTHVVPYIRVVHPTYASHAHACLDFIPARLLNCSPCPHLTQPRTSSSFCALTACSTLQQPLTSPSTLRTALPNLYLRTPLHPDSFSLHVPPHRPLLQVLGCLLAPRDILRARLACQHWRHGLAPALAAVTLVPWAAAGARRRLLAAFPCLTAGERPADRGTAAVLLLLLH